MSGLYRLVTQYPKLILLLILAITTFMIMQLPSLRWETDARVYMPDGHEAIKYDEKIEHVFGVKDAFIIGIKNEEKTIYNTETLEKIARITEKVAALPGVIANRTLDIASLTSATAFVGTDDSMGAVRLMEGIPQTEEALENLRLSVVQHADLFVGNIVSQDGTVAIIRAKLKEGADTRYQAYWQIKAILSEEMGESDEGAWGGGEWGQWSEEERAQWYGDDTEAAAPQTVEATVQNDKAVWTVAEQQNWHKANPDTDANDQPWHANGAEIVDEDNGDEFFIAGRPVIEVTSGLHAMEDLKVMVPLLLAVMAAALFLIFKTGRGVIVPLLVMSGAIIWTLGTMVLLDVPMYTISTMLPVILVAVGIADSVHLLSSYYNKAFSDPYRKSSEIVQEAMSDLGPPLLTTSVTTAIGFLALLFAEMPPFKVFGLFTVLGIFFSWVLTVTFAAAFLSILKPRVPGYLAKRRSMRVHTEQDGLTRALVRLGEVLLNNRKPALIVLAGLVVVSLFGASKLYVNSSWLSDFKEGTEVKVSTDILNTDLDGSVFLNIVIEAHEPGGIKSLALLQEMEGLQNYAETLDDVGDTLSVVDFLKNMSKSLHAEDEAFKILPRNDAEVAEYLYLYSVSGQPELLDEVVDFGYQRANITVSIQTDETKELHRIIDAISVYVDNNFSGYDVDVNYAGSANNSYIWADLLIDSQSMAIVMSKLGILIIAALIFKSFAVGMAVIVPVTLSTLFVAGAAGFIGIPMDVSTALAAGVAIGVGVDYAVHYIFRYMKQIRLNATHEEAVAETMRTVGRTIVFNVIVVSIGFAVLLLSQFPPHIKLGVFVVVYMLVSCLVALCVLPIVFRRSARV